MRSMSHFLTRSERLSEDPKPVVDRIGRDCDDGNSYLKVSTYQASMKTRIKEER